MDKKIINRIATFVYRPVKGLNDLHREFLRDNLPKYQFTKDELSQMNNLGLKHFYPYERLEVEIGFGNGEHLHHNAINNPNIGYIGAEPYIKGMVNLLKELESENKLSNIKLVYEDARNFLDCLNEQIIDRIYILFPDPWPKTKHFKRRIITKENLAYFKTKLKSNGEIIVATDHTGYKDWIRNVLQNTSQELGFEYVISHETLLPVKTKYQKKAEEEGRSAEFYSIKFIG